LQIPYIEKEMGDQERLKNNYTEAIKHYAKVGMALKILFEDNKIQQTDTEKYIQEVGVNKH
jgi:hypothetical protein